jgi:phosphoribosylglycinamide formyltransferase-1
LTPASRRSAAVLISGSGSNLQALIDATRDGRLALDIVVVASNRPDVTGLARARRAGIATECVVSADFKSRDAFDDALANVLQPYQPDFLLLAGFMRILTPAFVRHYTGRMLNIHPSLLPDYPGLDTHRRVLDAGDPWHGCTVHFLTDRLDGGPPIIQARVPVRPGDDAEQLAARVLALEHRIYPQAAEMLASGRLEWRAGNVWLDGQPLLTPLQYAPRL